MASRNGNGQAAPGAAPAGARADGEDEQPEPEEFDDDEDDLENALSLAAMEAELKPKVLETFDLVATNYKKLRKLQDQVVERALKNDSLSSGQEKRYKVLKDEIVAEIKSLSLNNNRIESLVETLYDINKQLLGYEGRLLRLAESYGVKREDFLDEYQGAELDPNWLRRVGRLKKKGWADFIRDESGHGQGAPLRDSEPRRRDGLADLRVPPHRAHRAEGRARGAPGQEGDGRGESAPRDLDRQEIHQSRPAIPRPDPGRQYRPDEGGR